MKHVSFVSIGTVDSIGVHEWLPLYVMMTSCWFAGLYTYDLVALHGKNSGGTPHSLHVMKQSLSEDSGRSE